MAASVARRIAANDLANASKVADSAVVVVQALAAELSAPKPRARNDLSGLSEVDQQKAVERMLGESRLPPTTWVPELAPLLASIRARTPAQRAETHERVSRLVAMVWTIQSRVFKAMGQTAARADALQLAALSDNALSPTLFERAGIFASEHDLEEAKRLLRAGVNNAHESGMAPEELDEVRDCILGNDPDWRHARPDPTFVAFVADLFVR